MKKRISKEEGNFEEIEQYLKKHGQDSAKFRNFMHQVYHDEHSSDEEHEEETKEHTSTLGKPKSVSNNNPMFKSALGQQVSGGRHTLLQGTAATSTEEEKKNGEVTEERHPRNIDDAVEQLQNQLTAGYMEVLTEKFGEAYDVQTLKTLLELNGFMLEKTVNQLSSMRRYEVTQMIQTEYMRRIREFESQMSAYDAETQSFEFLGVNVERRGINAEAMEKALFSEQDGIKLEHGPRVLLKEAPKGDETENAEKKQKKAGKIQKGTQKSPTKEQEPQKEEEDTNLVEEVVDALQDSHFNLLSDDLFIHLFLFLDPTSLARSGQVCTFMRQLSQKQCFYKRFSLMTWSEKPVLPEFSVLPNNFRLIWGDVETMYKIDRKYLKSFGSWKTMFTQRPRLRMKGCYVAKAQYTRTGARDVLTHHSDAPVVHLVTYWRYIRFLKDGSVMFYTTEKKPSKALKMLSYEHLSTYKGSFGEYIIYNDTIYLKVGMHESLYEYEFQLKGFTPGANNELKLNFYGVRSNTTDDLLRLPMDVGFPRHFRFYEVPEFENDSFFHAVMQESSISGVIPRIPKLDV